MKLYHLFWDEGGDDRREDYLLLGTYSSIKERDKARQRFWKNGYPETEDMEGQFIMSEAKLDKDDESMYLEDEDSPGEE